MCKTARVVIVGGEVWEYRVNECIMLRGCGITKFKNPSFRLCEEVRLKVRDVSGGIKMK